VRGLAHALLTAGDDDAGLAQRDLLGRDRHRPQAGAADLVQAPRRDLLRDAGAHARLTGRTLSRRRLQHMAQDHLVDVVRGHAGPLQRGADDDLAQLRGGKGREGAQKRPDRRARRGDDDHFD
jgi:hypothetical protein